MRYPNDKALVRIDKLGIIDSLVKALRNKIIIKIICPLSKENLEVQKKIVNAAPDIHMLNCAKSRHELLWNDRIANEESNMAYKMKQEFVSIAAHELKSPAQSIVGYTESLLADPKYKENIEDRFLGAIYRNSMRLSKLSKELLDLTRIENHTLQLRK